MMDDTLICMVPAIEIFVPESRGVYHTLTHKGSDDARALSF
jgi:hypothetical protein